MLIVSTIELKVHYLFFNVPWVRSLFLRHTSFHGFFLMTKKCTLSYSYTNILNISSTHIILELCLYTYTYCTYLGFQKGYL